MDISICIQRLIEFSASAIPNLSCYHYAGMHPSATHTWTNAETSWTTTSRALNAVSGSSYYLHIRGYNGDGVACGAINMGPYKCDAAGPSATVSAPAYLQVVGNSYPDLSANWGAVATATPTMYAKTYANLQSALANPDGTAVWIDAFETVTGVFGTSAYVEESNRSCGVRLDSLDFTPSVGNTYKIVGKLTGGTAERSLAAADATAAGSNKTIAPVFIRVSSMGGRPLNIYTAGLSNGIALYNIGLLVRAAGRVDSHGSGYFVLNDGSGATVKVYSTKTVTDGSFVGVTGVCSVESGARVLRTRAANDVVVYFQ